MRFCVILEDRYRTDEMPLDVARELTAAGHDVDVLEPSRTLTAVSELVSRGRGYDAWVLKTLSSGPGLSILEAAGVSGCLTINDAAAKRPITDAARWSSRSGGDHHGIAS